MYILCNTTICYFKSKNTELWPEDSLEAPIVLRGAVAVNGAGERQAPTGYHHSLLLIGICLPTFQNTYPLVIPQLDICHIYSLYT